MKVIAKTDRLILREFDPEKDAEPFFNLNEDAEVLKYTGDEKFASLDNSFEFLNSYSHYQEFGFGRWAVIEKITGRFLGWCGLKNNEENLVDIGFRIFRDSWGKGIATESANTSLEYGYANLKIPIIIGRTHVDNKASIRVLEKIGMKFWKDSDFEGIKSGKYYKKDNPNLGTIPSFTKTGKCNSNLSGRPSALNKSANGL